MTPMFLSLAAMLKSVVLIWFTCRLRRLMRDYCVVSLLSNTLTFNTRFDCNCFISSIASLHDVCETFVETPATVILLIYLVIGRLLSFASSAVWEPSISTLCIFNFRLFFSVVYFLTLASVWIHLPSPELRYFWYALKPNVFILSTVS